MNTVRFLVFADLHHYPGVFYTNALERFHAFCERAVREKAEFMISLGDFCHSATTFTDFMEETSHTPVPLFHVMGNHDTDGCALEEVLRLYRMPAPYYFFDRSGFRFIVIDTNYYECSTGCTHFQYRNYFDFPGSRETLPPDEIAWLEKSILESPYPCLLLSHCSIERVEGAEIRNRDKILEIIRKANANGRKVIMSLNGHHHRDGIGILENVAYFDVNSASFDWLSCPHSFFPKELTEAYELADHQAIFTKPLSAIVTVTEDAEITIEGMEGDFLYGVTREMTNNKRTDGLGRPCIASIRSAHFKLF